jgi:NSS family neurotransmitter:Na+ symporter
VGAPAALSNNLLADVKLFGLTFFDLYDFGSSNILLPVGGLFLAIFAGWVWGLGRFQKELSNQGVLQNSTVTRVMFYILKFVTPPLVLVVLLSGLKLI